MSIQNAVVDMEEYIWNDGGIYRMRGRIRSLRRSMRREFRWKSSFRM